MTTMTSPAPNTARHRWELAENKTMRLPRLRVPTVVRVERGTVLVTQEGDHEDHVLERGDELVVRRGGLAVAWAFTEATISMREVGRNGILALARKGRAGAAAVVFAGCTTVVEVSALARTAAGVTSMGPAVGPGQTVSTVPTWSPFRAFLPRLFQVWICSTETLKRWAMVHSESPD